jgi:hypothetical protein
MRDKPILSSERMLHEDYDRKNISGHEPQGAWSQDELVNSQLLVVK